MDIKPVQPSKPFNFVTDEGMVMEVKPVQWLKQPYPISVTDEGIVMDVKPVQPSKPFKDVTEEGIVMEVKPVQWLKQPYPISVTDEGMVMDVKPVQLPYLLLVDYQYYTL